MKSWYDILNGSPTASMEDIKKAYKELAKLIHPDGKPENLTETATNQFRLIKDAYEKLSNEKSRAEYDSILAAQSLGNRTHIINEKPTVSFFGIKVSWSEFQLLGVILLIIAFFIGVAFSKSNS